MNEELIKALYREVAATHPFADDQTLRQKTAALVNAGAFEHVAGQLRPRVSDQEALQAARMIDPATVNRLASAYAQASPAGTLEADHPGNIASRQLAAMGLANALGGGSQAAVRPALPGMSADEFAEIMGGGNDAA